MFATLPDALLRRANLPPQLITKLQVLFHRVPGLWWQFYQTPGNKIPSPYPKKVAYLFEGNCVSGKGSMGAVYSSWYECAPEKSSSAPALVGKSGDTILISPWEIWGHHTYFSLEICGNLGNLGTPYLFLLWEIWGHHTYFSLEICGNLKSGDTILISPWKSVEIWEIWGHHTYFWEIWGHHTYGNLGTPYLFLLTSFSSQFFVFAESYPQLLCALVRCSVEIWGKSGDTILISPYLFFFSVFCFCRILSTVVMCACTLLQ
jgi:hypothetical protein